MTSANLIADISLFDVEVNSRTTWRHIQLTTNGGLTGLGEATLHDTGPEFSSRLLETGQSLRQKQPDISVLDPLRLREGGLACRTILSAYDQAICDLQAQIAGQSLHAFLGAKPLDSSLALYANINRATGDRSPENFAQNARCAAENGFQAIKIAPFDGLDPTICDTEQGRDLIDAGIARIKATRKAVPDRELMVDCHWRLTPKAAASLLPELQDAGVTWFECPLPENAETIPDLRVLRQDANRRGVRLCGLETAGNWTDIAPFIEGETYDLIMPDVKHACGLRNILDIGRRAKTMGVGISLHNPTGPVAHLFSAHVMAALGSSERMEFQWNESPIFFDLIHPAPVITTGTCRPTDTPGLGAVMLDRAGYRRHHIDS